MSEENGLLNKLRSEICLRTREMKSYLKNGAISCCFEEVFIEVTLFGIRTGKYNSNSTMS